MTQKAAQSAKIHVSKDVYNRAGLEGKALAFMPDTVAELQELLSRKQHAVRVITDLEARSKTVRNTEHALTSTQFAKIKADLKTKRAQVQEITVALAEARKRDRIARGHTLAEIFMETVRKSVDRKVFENWLGQSVKQLPDHMQECVNG